MGRRRRYFDKQRQGFRNGISILPSLFTTISLLSGFFAIVAAIEGKFLHAAVAILVSGIFDALDGRVARFTGTTSRFGTEYDSLCDMVAFGVAPALFAFQWVLYPYGRYGWLAAFLYVAATALRLARFNSQAPGLESKNFTGLPCPAAGCLIATSYLFWHFWEISGQSVSLMMLVAVYLLSYLMISSIPYSSFKQLPDQGQKAFKKVAALVLLIMVLATEPQLTLFVLVLGYVLSGPLTAIYRLLVPVKTAAELKTEVETELEAETEIATEIKVATKTDTATGAGEIGIETGGEAETKTGTKTLADTDPTLASEREEKGEKLREEKNG